MFGIKSLKYYGMVTFSDKNNTFINLELRRTIGLENLLGVTKNMQKSSKEFVIHVDHEPDYRVTCEQYVPLSFNLLRKICLAIEFYLFF